MQPLRVWLRISALIAITLVGAPLQWVALKLGARRIYLMAPVVFHRLVCRIIGVRVHVRGTPPRGRPTLLVSNHVSWVDITAIASVAPLSFIAKSEVAGWPVFGQFARLQRSIFVDRSRKSATARVNAAIADRLASGEAMVLFAEGTTGDGLRVLPFRSALLGAVREAAGSAEIRVQPMSICYVARSGLPLGRNQIADIAWYGDMDLAPHLMALLRGGPWDVVISFGEAIVGAESAGHRKLATRTAETFARESMRRARRSSPCDSAVH